MNTIRLAHFSDIHITARPAGWTWPDYLTKRLTGWLHLSLFGRSNRFQYADRIVTALMAELRRQRPDHLIFSGDATALGFENEVARAATLLGLTKPDFLPGIAVPGNHDYYTPADAKSGCFEQYFAAWQKGQRLDGEIYPFAQRVGHVWLVAVNSCTGNRLFWDAGGTVDDAQLGRLERLLASLDPGIRVLVTHYPVCLATGQPEKRHHGLRNLDELVRVASRGGIALWLHGHRHTPYCLPSPGAAPFPIICAGSATEQERWSYGDYTLEDHQLHAVRRAFELANNGFIECETFELNLTRSV